MNKKTLERLALAEKIVELRKLGYTNQEIMNELKTSYSTVFNALKSAGLKPIRKNQADKLKRTEKVNMLRSQGLTNAQISEKIGIHEFSVSRIADKSKYNKDTAIRQEKINKILELKKQGFTRKEVANMLDFEYKFVWRHWNK